QHRQGIPTMLRAGRADLLAQRHLQRVPERLQRKRRQTRVGASDLKLSELNKGSLFGLCAALKPASFKTGRAGRVRPVRSEERAKKDLGTMQSDWINSLVVPISLSRSCLPIVLSTQDTYVNVERGNIGQKSAQATLLQPLLQKPLQQV